MAQLSAAETAEEQPVTAAPEQISLDTIMAEYGMLQVQLNAANRKLAALLNENAELRGSNAVLAQALELRQTPEGAPAGSAPRAQRRPADLAARREAAKALKAEQARGEDRLEEIANIDPTPIASKRKKGAPNAGHAD